MLYLNQNIKQDIIEFALSSNENNVYGFLLGIEKRDIRIIEEIVPIKNFAENKQQKITPKDYHNVELYAEEKGLILLGTLVITRNHQAYPLQDKTIISREYFSSLIVSVLAGTFLKLRSWRFDIFNKYVEERIVILKNQDYNIANSDNLKQLYSINYN